MVDSITRRKLIVLDAWRRYENEIWWNSDRPVCYLHSIEIPHYCYYGGCQYVLSSPGFQKILANVKFLSLGFQVWESNLETLNHFRALKELVILEVKGKARP